MTEHFAEYVQRLRRPGQYKPSTVQLAQVYALCIASAGQLQRLHNHEQVACLASTACTTASRSRGLVCTVRRHTAGFPTVSIINYFLDQEDRSISYRYRTHLCCCCCCCYCYSSSCWGDLFKKPNDTSFQFFKWNQDEIRHDCSSSKYASIDGVRFSI